MLNNLDQIIAKIQKDAACKIAEIEADRDGQTDALDRRTENLLADMEAAAKLQAKKDGDAILTRANAAASMTKRDILLQKKTALLDEVYRLAEEAIYNLPAEEYAAFLAKLTADAVTERMETVCRLTELYGEEETMTEQDESFSVVFSPSDKEKYGRKVLTAARAILKKRLKSPPTLVPASESADIPGGVVVHWGDMEICCSVPALIAGIREKTDTKIAAMLFD